MQNIFDNLNTVCKGLSKIYVQWNRKSIYADLMHMRYAC